MKRRALAELVPPKVAVEMIVVVAVVVEVELPVASFGNGGRMLLHASVPAFRVSPLPPNVLDRNR